MRFLPLLLLAFLLTGCGDLQTRYGTTDPSRQSVNGCSALVARLTERTHLHRAWQLSPHLDNADLIVHLADEPGLPSDDACAWLTRWLLARNQRTVVLILRDGNLAPFLCHRWAEEARMEASRAGAGQAEAEQRRLSDLATLLDQRASLEAESPWTTTNRQTCSLFSVGVTPPRCPLDVDGLTPLAMTIGVVPWGPGAVTIATARFADQTTVPYAISLPMGGSRLLVVANATPLLDGALADPQARKLTARIIEAILGDAPKQTAWVQELRVRTGEPEPANPMSQLFTADPFRWMAWHLTAWVLIALWASAAWLGRREDPRNARAQRFGTHVDTLAGHLRDGHHQVWCARAIARLRGLPEPPAGGDENNVRHWLVEHAQRSPRPPRKQP